MLEGSVLPVLKRLSWAADGNPDVAWVCDVLVYRAIERSCYPCGKYTVLVVVGFVGSYGSVSDPG